MAWYAHSISATVAPRFGYTDIRSDEGVLRDVDGCKESGTSLFSNMSSVLDVSKAIMVTMCPVMEDDLRVTCHKKGTCLNVMRKWKGS